MMRDGRLQPTLLLTAILASLTLLVAACGTGDTAGEGAPEQQPEEQHPQEEEAPPPPEPAEAPPTAEELAGTVVDLGSSPEGIAADPETGLVAVALRNPDELVLLDGDSGEVAARVALPESARHLDLAEPGGPVLVPAERANSLVQIGLPGGEVLKETPVGEFPHDAAASAAGGTEGRVFVVNEFEHTASAIDGGEVVETFETPLHPGGVAVTQEGVVGVIGVRGLALEAYDADTLKSFGRVEAGEGPTHLVAGPGERFYVADTRGDAVLVYEARPEPEQVESISIPDGSPYGIALDPAREELWVTLTAENRLLRFDISGEGAPRETGTYPTVRQPNSVAVDPATGRVFVTGAAEGELQILTP